jgi:hypothetical protein
MRKIQRAAAQANNGAKLLLDRGFQRLEITQDAGAGIEWSRWVRPFDEGGYLHVVLFATPYGWHVFEAVTYEPRAEAVAAGLDRAIKEH